jgi:hypothetical protein
MTTAAQTFPKKSLYHSDLAKHGPITVQFAGEPRDSQYPNKPRWVGLLVHGDDTKYTLNIENADVEASIKAAPKNTWVEVRAEGRGDQAFMLIEDGDGGPILPGDKTPPRMNQQQRPAPAQNGPPPNEWGGDEEVVEVTISGTTSATVALSVAMTLAAVRGLEAGGVRVDSDAAARMYNTHFIQATRG